VTEKPSESATPATAINKAKAATTVINRFFSISDEPPFYKVRRASETRVPSVEQLFGGYSTYSRVICGPILGVRYFGPSILRDADSIPGNKSRVLCPISGDSQLSFKGIYYAVQKARVE
jgi:hypothetical protein